MLVKPFSPCTSFPCLPLVISMVHGRPSSEYLRQRLKPIPAVPPPAKGAQQAHHRVFYKQKQCPLVLFHRLTLNTPPLCALFVFNNAPIQQKHYKSEHHNKKGTTPKFSGLSCCLHCVYAFPFICLSCWPSCGTSGLTDCCASKSVRLRYCTH